ncbi:hypothetical protein BC835DRAFT_709057 [Cytidiella melzeri]|nr:hypothetical protein BC835DRAFT_709057 [Cytidiella melzeri]
MSWLYWGLGRAQCRFERRGLGKGPQWRGERRKVGPTIHFHLQTDHHPRSAQSWVPWRRQLWIFLSNVAWCSQRNGYSDGSAALACSARVCCWMRRGSCPNKDTRSFQMCGSAWKRVISQSAVRGNICILSRCNLVCPCRSWQEGRWNRTSSRG